jgi:hypothetical protein
MKTHLLEFLKDIGLLETVPVEQPRRGIVLARGVCFLHDDADNRYAFMLYADGFVCATKGCHGKKEFGCNLEGLIRQMVHRITGEVMPWRAAWDWAREHADAMHDLVANKIRHGHASSNDGEPVTWSREDLMACLQQPDPFYLSRGYRAETLAHFGVGRCIRQLPDRKNLLGWAVVPIYDGPNRTVVGYTARNPHWVKGGTAIKWFHAVRKSEHLFNLWGARHGSLDKLFICEGPGCVMRLYEAGYSHAVATLGTPPTNLRSQLMALPSGYRKTVYIAADSDEYGQVFARNVHNQLKGVCDPIVLFPPAGYKDIGDMPTNEVTRWLSESPAGLTLPDEPCYELRDGEVF